MPLMPISTKAIRAPNGIAESGSGGDGAAGEPSRDGADPPTVDEQMDSEQREKRQSGDFMVCDAEGALVVQQNHRDQKKQVEGQPDSGFDVHGDTSGNGQGGCRQGHEGCRFSFSAGFSILSLWAPGRKGGQYGKRCGLPDKGK